MIEEFLDHFLLIDAQSCGRYYDNDGPRLIPIQERPNMRAQTLAGTCRKIDN